jgi:hypothetical protein
LFVKSSVRAIPHPGSFKYLLFASH